MAYMSPIPPQLRSYEHQREATQRQEERPDRLREKAYRREADEARRAQKGRRAVWTLLSVGAVIVVALVVVLVLRAR
jgi:Flp pilus assembly protein TadB